MVKQSTFPIALIGINLVVIILARQVQSNIFPSLALPNYYDNPSVFDHVSVKTDAPTNTSLILPSLADIKYYINFVTVVYGKYDESTTWNCAACSRTGADVTLARVLLNRLANTLAMFNIRPSRQEIIVTFRGTANLANYLQDIMFLGFPVSITNPGMDGENIRVHSGFWKATNSLYADTVQILKELMIAHPGIQRLVFVGHSLGAPIAVLMGFRIRCLAEFSHLDYSIYSYAQPRTGNQGFADWVNKQNITLVRVVNRGDVIPHVLPRGVFPAYIHHQNELWIKQDGSFKYCSRDVYEDPTCSNSMGPLGYNIHDHTTGYSDSNLLASLNDNLCEFLHQFLINLPPLTDINICSVFQG